MLSYSDSNHLPSVKPINPAHTDMAGEGFSGWDWAVFAVILVGSLGTGVFAGCVARRKARKGDAKSTAAEFLMGGRQLNPFAVALSTMIGVASSITILGEY